MNQKFYLLFFVLAFEFSGLVYGQTGIGTNMPHESAQLEVQSTNKGILIPRMTESQKNAILNPATGLLVYQTDGENAGFYYFDGMEWVNLAAQGSPDPNLAEEGFSATAALAVTVIASTQIGGWTVSSPYFNTTTFDPLTGTFTVPNTGRYQISATINYKTPQLVFTPIGINPAFVVRRINPVITDLVSGYLPFTDYGVLPTGTVTLIGVVELNAGDTVGLFYEDDGYLFELGLGGADSPIVWSLHQIAD